MHQELKLIAIAKAPMGDEGCGALEYAYRGLDADSEWLLKQVLDPHLRQKLIAIHPRHLIQAICAAGYGNLLSVGLKWDFQTGCRLAEMDRMLLEHCQFFWITWALGKNQTGRRREYIGPDLMNEMRIMRQNEKCKENHVFPCNGETFARYFNDELRPLLPPVWKLKHPFPPRGNIDGQYIYQLKGIRKTFVTLRFWYYFKKYNSADVALEMVCRDMGHSSKGMTAGHYLACAHMIEAEKYYNLLPHEMLDKIYQKSLVEFVGK